MKKADLLFRAKELEVDIPEGLTNKDIEVALGTAYYNKHPEVQTFGMQKRLFEYQTPQLCFSFKELKPEEQKNILESENWIAETKVDGLRCVVTYHPNHGFEFFSRDISELTFLPNNYTDKILLIHNGKVRTPKSYKGMFKQSFIIDGEVLVIDKNLDTTKHGGGFSVTELNATVSILGSASERAKQIQMDGNALHFYMFDCLELGDKRITGLPLRQRRKCLENLLSVIGQFTPFKITESNIDNKQKFFDDIVTSGGEGTVLKNLDAEYFATSSRKRNVQVKMKRTVSNALNSDIDAFISGAIFPKKNSALDVQKLIGGIKVSVFLKEDDGSLVEHHIGTISAITDSLRRKMTSHDEEGRPILNKEYLDKVLVIEGQDISSSNHRLSHCRAVDWNFRTDKGSSDCILTRKFIMEQIL
jgi:ATP-dependent DNA ligase